MVSTAYLLSHYVSRSLFSEITRIPVQLKSSLSLPFRIFSEVIILSDTNQAETISKMIKLPHFFKI